MFRNRRSDRCSLWSDKTSSESIKTATRPVRASQAHFSAMLAGRPCSASCSSEPHLANSSAFRNRRFHDGEASRRSATLSSTHVLPVPGPSMSKILPRSCSSSSASSSSTSNLSMVRPAIERVQLRPIAEACANSLQISSASLPTEQKTPASSSAATTSARRSSVPVADPDSD